MEFTTHADIIAWYRAELAALGGKAKPEQVDAILLEAARLHAELRERR